GEGAPLPHHAAATRRGGRAGRRHLPWTPAPRHRAHARGEGHPRRTAALIGHLRGRLAFRQPPHLLVEVQGVGYELEAPMTTFYNLPEVGAALPLYARLVVRGAADLLSRPASGRGRRLFRAPLSVSGVAARRARRSRRGLEADALAQCLQAGGVDWLVRR